MNRRDVLAEFATHFSILNTLSARNWFVAQVCSCKVSTKNAKQIDKLIVCKPELFKIFILKYNHYKKNSGGNSTMCLLKKVK